MKLDAILTKEQQAKLLANTTVKELSQIERSSKEVNPAGEEEREDDVEMGL